MCVVTDDFTELLSSVCRGMGVRLCSPISYRERLVTTPKAGPERRHALQIEVSFQLPTRGAAGPRTQSATFQLLLGNED